ncbi:hypothetical protein AVEN_179414-1 [Araneus ventricosus]|uniref:Uncharacterized protein n=1 Tax=Araneus ventricosus TaxID=182803 RepID=A0A4Y2BFH3_ARAVE|nr:hypothetical protein AVEN_179414-1 [Araneus ventricosus]
MDKWLNTGTFKRVTSRIEIQITDSAATDLTRDQSDDDPGEVQRDHLEATDWLFQPPPDPNPRFGTALKFSST